MNSRNIFFKEKMCETAPLVLVTGGTGLVGTALRDIDRSSLGFRWVFSCSSDADLRCAQATEKMFCLHRPTFVIHLAARVGGLYSNLEHPVSMYEDNCLININVLRCVRRFQVKKTVCCLSTCIFPAEPADFPMDESSLHCGAPHPSNESYAYAKRGLEVLCRSYRAEYGTNIVCVIPSNLYGENDNYNLEEAHVIPALIHKCFLALKSGTDFNVCGSGRPLRQFLYAKDFAKLLIWALQNYESKEPLITCNSEHNELTISCAAQCIANSFEFKGNITFSTSHSDGILRKTVTNKVFRSLCPHFSFTALQQGIDNSVKWFLKNHSTCRL